MSSSWLRGKSGNNQQAPPPPPSPYDRAPAPPDGSRYNRPLSGSPSQAPRGHYAEEKSYYRPQPQQGLPGGDVRAGGMSAPTKHQMPASRQTNAPPHGGQVWNLRVDKNEPLMWNNLVGVSATDFPQPPGRDFYLMVIVNNLAGSRSYVVTARVDRAFSSGTIGMSEAQRKWTGVSLMDTITAEMYDPFSKGNQCYLGALDLEVRFARTRTTKEQLDQDELAMKIAQNFENQIFAPGQQFIMEFKSVPLWFTIQTVQLGDLSMQNASTGETRVEPEDRGILVKSAQMTFFKGDSIINLKASKRRPATNAILQPTFKFEDMGIGGLDKEFSAIFRRAFQSRIFPPGLIQNLGIQHVKGILLFGPPGTGKTLIARKIGQMLNAREPKVINGPEVLNKFVGQSEENIRKLFADAEKEYKEKGDESGLHIIIFDELDAVCKQRGSGAGGGTGVGDSVVNQLLSKLDGVDQLNNILLIGMTNRKDMIDDALLRPGRLEVHMEISLPDEEGRQQILKIHTAPMSKNGNLDRDVSLAEIAHRAKNFSGAELNGLVRSAASWALNRHVKVGTMAGISDDVEHMAVNRGDFEKAFEEVKPAFGVSEEELETCLVDGILHYSPSITNIIDEGGLYVKQVQSGRTQLFSAVFHGPPGSGKTALAAKVALDSGYPFIKLCSPNNMVGFDANMKINALSRVFEDAYKSPLSVVVLDDIERLIGWGSIGPRYDNGVLQALMALTKKKPPRGRRLLILATTSQRSVIEQLQFFESFNADIAVPTLASYNDLAYVMSESHVFDEAGGRGGGGGGSRIARSINELRRLTDGRETLNVGIKDILLAIQTAERDEDPESRFATEMGRKIARMGLMETGLSRGAPGGGKQQMLEGKADDDFRLPQLDFQAGGGRIE